MKQENIIIVGASGRDAGKTLFTCELIRALKKHSRVFAAKVTTVKVKNEQCHRGEKSCGICSNFKGGFEILEEYSYRDENRKHTHSDIKDSTKMALAGADSVFWVRSLESHLEQAVKELTKRLSDNTFLVIESNSVRKFLTPGLFVILRKAGSENIKPSCAEVISMADKIIEYNGRNWSIHPEDIIQKIAHSPSVNNKMKNITAIILAGGASRRMGRDKSMLSIDGEPMISRIAKQLKKWFGGVIVGANDSELYSFLNCTIVPDKETNRGPLAGIASCIEASKTELNFIIACDIPIINLTLIEKMADVADNFDIVVPVNKDGTCEPLFAIYRRSVLPAAKKMLNAGNGRVQSLLDVVKTKTIKLAPKERVININTEKDYRYLHDNI